MANQEKKSNNAPLAIIGLVLVAAVAGGYWLYSSSNGTPTTSNTTVATTPPQQPANTSQPATADKAAEERYKNAPRGAQPAHTLGSQTAAVTVEEFADFQCPTCATVHGLMKQINTKYGDKIKFVYRNFPLTQIHPNAMDAAAAAEAAGRQGKFWDMQNLLFVNQKDWSNSAGAKQIFENYAGTIGLDAAKFKSDFASMAVRSRIDNDVARARALGVNSTPTIYINGKSVDFKQMTLEGVSGMIDTELKNAETKPESNSEAEGADNADKKEADAKDPKPEEKK